MQIIFSILHYQVIDVTIECVDALLKMHIPATVTISVIIVDNNSPNESGIELEKKYADISNVYVIRNTENLGFAKGNNVGFLFAKEKLSPDVFIAMNNDVLIKQEDFLDLLLRNSTDADVIAPNIINSEGKHQNPMRVHPMSNKKVNLISIYTNINKFIAKYPPLNKSVVKLISFIKKEQEQGNDVWKQKQENIVPHGAMIIYCRKYIDNENFVFIPDTFMYYEEDILYDYLISRNYKILYIPNITVLHYEDVATDAVSSGTLEKRKFMFCHKAKSLKVLKKWRKQLQEYK